MKRSFGFRRLALPGVLAVGVFCALPSAPGCPSPPPIVTIEATDAWADEVGPDTGTFTVTRTGDTSSALTVYYRTAGTATEGSDYQSLDGWVQIQQGNNSADITLTPIQDLVDDECLETATVALISDANYEVGTPYYATVTIVDAQLETDDLTDSSPTEKQLAEWLVGPAGFTVLDDMGHQAQFTGDSRAVGTFREGTCGGGLPIEEGVILSTGDIHYATGPNSSSGPGWTDFEIYDGYELLDNYILDPEIDTFDPVLLQSECPFVVVELRYFS